MEIAQLLKAEASVDRVWDIASAAVTERAPGEKFPRYFDALDGALKDEPPPFGTKRYEEIFEEAAQDPTWVATSLITNAEREGDGATRLWSLAACTPSEEEKALLKRHAVDESGHALFYLSLLNLTFPNAASEDFRKELRTLSPHYRMQQEPAPVEGSDYARVPTMDDYIQMNIAEIRTTIHHMMQRKAIEEFVDDEKREHVLEILDKLLMDELSHVAYTAILIDELSERNKHDSERLTFLFRKRMKDFNDITRDELKDLIFD